MLPAELLYEVCNHLDARDIFSLSLACRDNKLSLEPLMTLFRASPWYQKRFSSWDSWQLCAANYKEPAEKVVFGRAKLPRVVNQPLPDDFTVLRVPAQYRDSLHWTTCDRGVHSLDADVSIELTAEPSFESVRPIYNVVSPDPLPEGSEADPFGDSSALVSAQTVWNAQEELWLVVKDCDGQVRSFPRQTDCESRVRIFDGVVLIGSYDYRGYSCGDGSLYLLSSAKTLKPVGLVDTKRIRVDEWLLYNGDLFKVVVGKGNKFHVVSLDMDIKQTGPDCYFYVCHDDRNPRYALAHRLHRVGLQYVIDMEKRLVHPVPRSRQQIHFVGISNGQLGIWSFDQTYLDKH